MKKEKKKRTGFFDDAGVYGAVGQDMPTADSESDNNTAAGISKTGINGKSDVNLCCRNIGNSDAESNSDATACQSEIALVGDAAVLQNGEIAADTESRGRLKKALIGSAVLLGLLLLLAAIKFISGGEFLSTGGYIPSDWLESENSGLNTKLEFYPADWDTDIFTLEDYLELSPFSINYSDDGGTSFQKISAEEAFGSGGNGLKLVCDYLDAIRNAEIDKINAMFTEKYLEKSEGYSEKFPKQKIFDIEIIRYRYSNPEHDAADYDDYYFIVSYKIYRNDGLFRDDIDGESSLPQMVEVFVYDNGDVRINNIFDLPGFTGIV